MNNCCCGLTFTIEKERDITFTIEKERDISFSIDGKVIETGNYNKLINQPSINEVKLIGNKTFEELGDHNLTNIEIKTIFDRVFNS